MGTFAFCEILCSVLRQSRFRLVHEFKWSSRRLLCCKIYKDNFKHQLPGVRLLLAPKWYLNGVSLCSCQSSNIIMPKRKLDDGSDPNHKDKTESNEGSEIHSKNTSRKHSKKKKKSHHHRHKKSKKKKHSKRRSTQREVIVTRKIELVTLDSSADSDSDICIIYDSQIKNRKCVPKHFNGQTERTTTVVHSELNNDNNSANTVEVEAKIGEDTQEGNIQDGFDIVNKVSEQCSSERQSPESMCISEEEQHINATCASISPEVDTSSFLKSDEAGPSSGTRPDENCSKYRFKRRWESNFGQTMTNATKDSSSNKENYLMFNVLSYNVLCQEIMEQTMHLYGDNDPSALTWDYRSKLLMEEFVDFNADIMCLQEVQESHLKSFYSQLHDMGYTGLYKRRTGDKTDGVAIYFKNATFQLVDYTTVEYYQPGVSVLNRDNVGLIVKLAPRMKPDERVIVATTHLLYNPRRHDVKLAQVQVLLAEVERFAFKGLDESTSTTKYWPIILTGDMNFEPNTGGFQLLNKGWFRYDGLSSKTLTTEYYGYGQILGKELIPSFLGVTDACQHWSIVAQRSLQFGPNATITFEEDHKTEVKLLQIYNSDFKQTCSDDPQNSRSRELYQLYVGCQEGFGSGRLSHTLQLTSVYNHDPKECSRRSQVSTFQDGWIAVDYIFYSKQEGNLKLVARYKLLNEKEAIREGPIPNLSSPSDHYPLAAKFALVF